MNRPRIIRRCKIKRLAKIERMPGYSYIHYFTGVSFKNWSFGILSRKKKGKK